MPLETESLLWTEPEGSRLRPRKYVDCEPAVPGYSRRRLLSILLNLATDSSARRLLAASRCRSRNGIALPALLTLRSSTSLPMTRRPLWKMVFFPFMLTPISAIPSLGTRFLKALTWPVLESQADFDYSDPLGNGVAMG